jgi:hypothetical protein
MDFVVIGLLIFQAPMELDSRSDVVFFTSTKN